MKLSTLTIDESLWDPIVLEMVWEELVRHSFFVTLHGAFFLHIVRTPDQQAQRSRNENVSHDYLRAGFVPKHSAATVTQESDISAQQRFTTEVSDTTRPRLVTDRHPQVTLGAVVDNGNSSQRASPDAARPLGYHSDGAHQARRRRCSPRPSASFIDVFVGRDAVSSFAVTGIDTLRAWQLVYLDAAGEKRRVKLLDADEASREVAAHVERWLGGGLGLATSRGYESRLTMPRASPSCVVLLDDAEDPVDRDLLMG
ncbi:MAG: hypothetical protein AAF715_15515 [Myxococcota bacterium]